MKPLHVDDLMFTPMVRLMSWVLACQNVEGFQQCWENGGGASVKVSFFENGGERLRIYGTRYAWAHHATRGNDAAARDDDCVVWSARTNRRARETKWSSVWLQKKMREIWYLCRIEMIECGSLFTRFRSYGRCVRYCRMHVTPFDTPLPSWGFSS